MRPIRQAIVLCNMLQILRSSRNSESDVLDAFTMAAASKFTARSRSTHSSEIRALAILENTRIKCYTFVSSDASQVRKCKRKTEAGSGEEWLNWTALLRQKLTQFILGLSPGNDTFDRHAHSHLNCFLKPSPQSFCSIPDRHEYDIRRRQVSGANSL